MVTISIVGSKSAFFFSEISCVFVGPRLGAWSSIDSNLESQSATLG